MSIYSLLQNDSAVSAITNEIHIGQAPQGTSAPYVVLHYVNVNPDNLLEGAATTDNQRIGVYCYGTDQNQSISLYDAARAALETDNKILNVNIYGELDPEDDVYRTQFDVSEWVNR